MLWCWPINILCNVNVVWKYASCEIKTCHVYNSSLYAITLITIGTLFCLFGSPTPMSFNQKITLQDQRFLIKQVYFWKTYHSNRKKFEETHWLAWVPQRQGRHPQLLKDCWSSVNPSKLVTLHVTDYEETGVNQREYEKRSLQNANPIESVKTEL